jgi:uncharacterized phage protein (TIGR01671 family)
MREIECRGWDKDTGRWYYGSYVRLERTTPYPMSQNPELDAQKFEEEQVDHYIFFTESTDWGLETRKLRATVDPKSVGQYTSLRCKNGKKLYDQDILELEGSHPSYDLGGIALIEWSDEDGGWFYEKREAGEVETGYLVELLAEYPDSYVIGNKYQNPELLDTPAGKEGL